MLTLRTLCSFLGVLKTISERGNLNLVAVDEAHCISTCEACLYLMSHDRRGKINTQVPTSQEAGVSYLKATTTEHFWLQGAMISDLLTGGFPSCNPTSATLQ